MAARTPRAAAVASDPRVASVAAAALKTGHAVDAVAAGVLAACALVPSVLFGPLQILVGGGGSGLHAVDGRVRQPGKGLARPRGFVQGEAVPQAAFVGVPLLPAAVATVVASFGRETMSTAVGPAVVLGRAVSKPRSELLSRMAERGPRALSDPRAVQELLLVAGRGQGGLLSERDLEELRPSVARAQRTRSGGLHVASVPWGARELRAASEPDAELVPPSRATRIVAAADARGQFAVACYEVTDSGLHVPALDLVLPLLAAPVMRGRTRVPPGAPCPSPAPVALVEEEGKVVAAAGLGERDDAESVLAAWIAAEASITLAAPPPGLVAVHRAGLGLEAVRA